MLHLGAEVTLEQKLPIWTVVVIQESQVEAGTPSKRRTVDTEGFSSRVRLQATGSDVESVARCTNAGKLSIAGVVPSALATYMLLSRQPL